MHLYFCILLKQLGLLKLRLLKKILKHIILETFTFKLKLNSNLQRARQLEHPKGEANQFENSCCYGCVLVVVQD